MARDSFIFYRSFLEAIKCMPSEVQAEIYPAIVEYALNGKEPKGLSDIAKGVFILIKPVMDANNARSEGGKKGKKFGKLGGRPAKDRAVSSAISDKPNVTPGYTLTLEQEIEEMRADRSWKEPVCMQFHIREDELGKRLDSFLNHCRCEYEGKSHDNINDAKRHFCSWMRKAYSSHAEPEDAQELPIRLRIENENQHETISNHRMPPAGNAAAARQQREAETIGTINRLLASAHAADGTPAD